MTQPAIQHAMRQCERTIRANWQYHCHAQDVDERIAARNGIGEATRKWWNLKAKQNEGSHKG